MYKAIERKKVSGTSPDDIPESSLWYYNDMFFIKDQLEIAATETSESPLDVDSQLSQDSESTSPSGINTTPTSNPAPPPQKRNKRKVVDTNEQLVGLATEYFKWPETEEDIMAKGWAMKLKKIPPDQRRFAEKNINDTIFEAEMGTLTREGVKFIRPWTPSTSTSSSSNSSNWQDYSNSAQPIYLSHPSPSFHHGQNQDDDSATNFCSFTSM
ncbi:uncharacterized protein [Leptinotarsa decemlineata]|uniref:uncharacterized protein n=1 Tax=Leptinotarsa decemlineata TaxID=7539 RepID=UPI003D309D7C